MKTLSDHPMDEFPVRPLKFDFNNIEFQDPLWSRTRPEFSMFLNSLGLHVPYFERYLVKTMSVAKRYIKDERLRRDVSAIIGQEAHHAKNFIDLNSWFVKRYPKVEQLDREAREYFTEHAKTDKLKKLVGFTAGYETFTFIAGMLVLDNHDIWFKDSDPVMKGLWIWHQVEEVEHGAVAFDVYKALYGEHEWYRKWMVLAALLHIAKETLKCYWHMSKREGWLRNPFVATRKLGFCAVLLCRFLKTSFPVFSRHYHPRNHPLVTNRQNPIQQAWRRYDYEGGDVLAIDHRKMAEIMGVPVAMQEAH